MDLTRLPELVSGALVTLVAAFAGAWYAFRLTDRAAARQVVRDQVAAVNRAQFNLIQQINLLTNVQTHSIDPIRDHPGRFLAMRPLTSPIASNVGGVDVDGLSFLLETEDRELLFELIIEGQRFQAAVRALEDRSRVHLETAQPRLAAAQIAEGVFYSLEQIETALGTQLFLHLRRATDEVIDLVDQTRESSEALVAKFRVAMKRRFPKFSIIHLDKAAPPTAAK